METHDKHSLGNGFGFYYTINSLFTMFVIVIPTFPHLFPTCLFLSTYCITLDISTLFGMFGSG